MRIEDAGPIAASLVANRNGPFGQFSVTDVRRFILTCILKARRLLGSHPRILFSLDPGDLAATTISVICKRYGEADVPNLAKLHSLATRILKNDFIDVYRKKENEGLDEWLPNPRLDDPGDEVAPTIDAGDDVEDPSSVADPRRSEEEMISRIGAKQKIEELERRLRASTGKIRIGTEKFGQEFLDLVLTLLTPEGSAAIHGVDEFDRPLIGKVREQQGRSKISSAQLERHIKVLRDSVWRLIADEDHKPAPKPKRSKSDNEK